MALVLHDSFLDCNLMPKSEWGATPGFAVTTGRDGQANGAASMAGASNRVLTLPVPVAVCIVGWAQTFTGSSVGNANNHVALRDTAGTNQLVLFVNAAGFIELRRTSATGTLLATSSGHAAITSNVWHHYQWRASLSTTSATVVIRLDDVQVLTYTGVTSSTNSNVTGLYWTGFQVAWDDLYLADATDGTATQSRPNNDFLGDLRVACQFPSAAGDVTGWTPSTGANWAAVDETPPSTTDYVSAVSTATGTRDLYQVTDLVGSIAQVYGVRACLYALKSDAGAALIKPVLKENGVTTSQASQGLPTTVAGVFGPALYVKPSNGSSWSASDVNALQIGVEVG
jgi:hypothetical protein